MSCCRGLTKLRLHQDRQRLLVGVLGEHLEFRQRAAADRVLDHDEWIIGQTHHARDILGRDLKRFGAQHNRAFAVLFEADAIMQTAR